MELAGEALGLAELPVSQARTAPQPPAAVLERLLYLEEDLVPAAAAMVLVGAVEVVSRGSNDLLTRDETAVAQTAASYPIRSATLGAKATRGGGPPFRCFSTRSLCRWGDAIDSADGLVAKHAPLKRPSPMRLSKRLPRTSLHSSSATPVRRAFSADVNLERRGLKKGQKAMALAMLFPISEKGGRGKQSAAKTAADRGGFSMDRLHAARAIRLMNRRRRRGC